MMEFEPELPTEVSEPSSRTTNGQIGNTGQQQNIPPHTVIDPIHQALRELFQQASALPKSNPRRRKLIDRLIVQMQQSDRLWTDKQNLHHEDAASETWIYLIRKLNGETDTDYDPEKGSLITLWNRVYERKLRELSQARKNKQTQWEASQRVHPRHDSETGQWQDAIATVAEPESTPTDLEVAQALIEADPTGKLRQTSIRRDRLDVTVQTLALEIVQRLQRGEQWTLKQLAEHFQVPEGTMNSFWSQKCKPLLRELGQSAGDY